MQTVLNTISAAHLYKFIGIRVCMSVTEFKNRQRKIIRTTTTTIILPILNDHQHDHRHHRAACAYKPRARSLARFGASFLL